MSPPKPGPVTKREPRAPATTEAQKEYLRAFDLMLLKKPRSDRVDEMLCRLIKTMS